MKKIAFLILSVMLLVGCSTDKNEQLVEQKVTDFFEGYKNKDKSISKFLIGSSEMDSMSFDGISVYFAEKLNYEIKSCKKTSDTEYNVEAEVETIDFKDLFTTAYDQTVEEYGESGITNNFINEINKKISNNDYTKSEFTCNVIVRNIDDEFKIQMDSSLANALTGGMNEYLDSLQEVK